MEWLRIYVTDRDRIEGQPAGEFLLSLLHKRGFAGATLIHGQGGYGYSGREHRSHILALSDSLPNVLETIDTVQKINEIFPELEELLLHSGGGVLLRQPVEAKFIRGPK